jgi:hypothetical protein
MTGEPPHADRMDRYVRGELSSAEARELAQASLDSPELFAKLADAALAKAALHSRTLPSDKIVRFPRKALFLGASVAAVAALVLISLAIVRPWRTANPRLKPVLSLSTAPGQPVLLADGLQPMQTSPDGAPVFRGPETDSRAPRTSGSIVSIEDGVATIDLGSLDGLAKDSELQVFRDDRPAQTIARLQVTTVFRERVRVRIIDGRQVRARDRVRVEDATHLDALLDNVAALYNRGAAEAAQEMAEQASLWVETANVPRVRQSAWWNDLAVLRMLRGDYQGAEGPLTRAVAASPKSGLSYARNMNNLGASSELRGDQGRAESRYADAVQAFANVPDAPEQELRAAQANLARLRGSH